MDLANHVKDICELLLHLFLEFLVLLFVDDADTALEVADDFLVGDGARFVDLVI